MSDKLSEQLAKEIAEMSDEAVEVATKKYFMKNPCEEINIGVNELHYNPMEVDEGWEPPYRNKNACLEQKLAKEIGEMSDEAVEVAVEKYFVKNPCNEIKVGVRDYYKLRSLYEGVLSRINKLEDDTRAAIEFADLAEDDRGTEMILKFCDDITKLVGE